MKVKALVVLFVFVLGFIIVVSVMPGINAASQRPSGSETKWIMPKGAEFPDEKKPEYMGMKKEEYFMYSMLEKYKELAKSLEYLYEKGDAYDFYRMGLLLERQGAVIITPEGAITGLENIAGFLAHQRKKIEKLIFDLPLEAEVSTIQKVIEGYLVDRVVRLKFQMRFIDKEGDKILQNDNLNASLMLLHRNICKPDG